MGQVSFGRSAIVLYTTIVLMLGWSYEFWRVRNDREVTLNASLQQLELLSRGLDSQFAAMVNDGVGAARAGARVLADFPQTPDRRRILGDMLTGGNYVRALFVVVGEQVTIANATGENLRDGGAWLTELRSSPLPTWVGPIRVESDGVKLSVAQRIGEPAGAGWAGSVLRISDLEEVYRDLQVNRTTLSLVSLSGRVIVQLPRSRDSSLDVDISDSSLYQRFIGMPVRPMTLAVGPRPTTGELRQFAIGRMERLPLLAVSSRPVEAVLGEWRARKQSSLQFMAVVTAIVLALAIALQTLLNRRFVALERSEARFQLAAAGTNDGLLEWEAGTGMVYCTQRALELLRLPGAAGSVAIDVIRSLVHPADIARVTTAFRRHVDDRVPLDVEARLLAGSESRWFRMRGQALWNELDEPVRLAGAIGDIHAAVQAQQTIADARRAELDAKESLARELLLAQERERKRLAGELHDGVGQNLSLLRNRAVLLQRTDLPPAAVPHAQAMLELSTESIQDLRNVAQNLRPMLLEELGVAASLVSLLQRVEQSSELKVHFRIEDIDDAVDADAATHVYRIVQEAINNVLKHAAAGKLWVEVIRDIGKVIIDIRDDGKGFGSPVSAVHAGLGLLSIRERCSILRAELEIESSAGQGAHLRVQIPDAALDEAASVVGGQANV